MNDWKINRLEELKEEAGITDKNNLLVQVPFKDPYNCTSEFKKALAQWFVEQYERFFESGTKIHIRRLHYKIISQKKPILYPKGRQGCEGVKEWIPYENTEKCSEQLIVASQFARYLDLIDPELIEDQKNPNPIININRYRLRPHINSEIMSMELDIETIFGKPNYGLYEVEPQQKYQLEVWVEKSTMNDILVPLCQKYRANLATFEGQVTLTSVTDGLRRWKDINEQTGKADVRIFHVTDFDPQGQDMPIALGRKIQYFMEKDDLLDELNVKLFHIILTQEQVQQYELPRIPIKGKDKGKEQFNERFGEGATELDALEALYPGEFEKIIKSHFDEYFDHTLKDRIIEAKDELESKLEQASCEIKDKYSDEIGKLEGRAEEINEELESLKYEQEDLVEKITDELDSNCPYDESDLLALVPEAEDSGENGNGLLFDSGLDYLSQLEIFHEFQDRDVRKAIAREKTKERRAKAKIIKEK